jgi:HAD superfamily hydrolase (TIGR01509 family)
MSLDLHQFDAVIFDMDGILIDSEPLWKIAMEDVFRSVGSTLTKADFQKTVGLRIDEVVRFWHQHEGWKDFTPAQMEQDIVSRMIELIRLHGQELNGVTETLQFLHDKEKKIGLATSSYTVLIQTVLDVLKLDSFFHYTHSAEHEEFGKPHPAVYLTTAQKLKVTPSRCLVIEDSLNGIISAKAARMSVVCIPEKTHHSEPRLSLADHRFESMTELLRTLS